jgi:hypothetical protein
MFPQIREAVWSGAGSNRRPSAFQVNRAKRCADLRKRTSLTSGTALGGRCNFYASRAGFALSTRHDGSSKGVVTPESALSYEARGQRCALEPALPCLRWTSRPLAHPFAQREAGDPGHAGFPSYTLVPRTVMRVGR